MKDRRTVSSAGAQERIDSHRRQGQHDKLGPTELPPTNGAGATQTAADIKLIK